MTQETLENTQALSEGHLQKLSESIEEANALMIYMVKSGKAVDHSVVTTITKINHSGPVSGIDAELENEFWKAYAKLSHAVQPATIETIMVNCDIVKTADKDIVQKKLSKKNVISFYSKMAIGVLLFALILQIVWLSSSTLVSKFQETIELKTRTDEKLSTLQLQFDQLIGEQQKIKDANGTEVMQKLIDERVEQFTREFKKLGDESKHIYQTYQNYLDIIQSLRSPIQYLSDYSDVTQITEKLILHYLNIFNAIMVGYILPLFLGWLGANVYILRQISNNIRNMTFLPESSQGFKLRIFLGIIAGVTFSWLFGFLIPTGDEGEFASASPLAIAFLVGYSVEILFRGMDKLTGSFTQS